MKPKAKLRELYLYFPIFIVLIISGLSDLKAYGPDLGPELEIIPVSLDTIPLKDRFGDFVNDDDQNPFDILPSEIEQKVEYDPETDTYVIYEKIGDEYYRTPSYMTFDEYVDWRAEQQEQRYFDKLAGYSSVYKSASGRIDPMSKVDIEKRLIDRLFGGDDITIAPQGAIDLSIGGRYIDNKNPQVTRSQQVQWFIPDFDMDIEMNVEGNIGDKMDLDFNYDTNASFDFDREIKLAYDSEKWTEDDIIKKIEAGNVSFPLRSSLIQGAQELFGLKTEMKFGHLTLTGVLSQQRSEQNSINVQNGATVQEFQLRPQDYDENRHFFISHYHRSRYEEAVSGLPYIDNDVRIINIEVWISDDRPNFQSDQTMIAAIADIAEADETKFSQDIGSREFDIDDTAPKDCDGNLLPTNDANSLFNDIITTPGIKRINSTATLLNSVFRMEAANDYETFRGRKLSTSEYYLNPELGFISLNVRLRPNQVLSVSYEYQDTRTADSFYKVGGMTDESSVANRDSTNTAQSEGVIFTKLLKGSNQRTGHPTWDLMMKNVYPLRASQLSEGNFQFDIFYEDDQNGTLKKFLPVDGLEFTPLLNMFGLDKLNTRNDAQPDGVFDFVPGVTVIPQSGSIIFPVLEPFGDALRTSFEEELPNLDPSEIEQLVEQYAFSELYDTSVVIASLDLLQNKFVMAGRVESSSQSEFSLGAFNVPRGSVRVTAGSFQLQEGVHFEVDYGVGRVRIIDQSIVQQGVPINITFEDNAVFSLQQKNMMGLRAEYEFDENFLVGGTAMRLVERPFTNKVNIGDDPITNSMFGLDMDFSKESPFLTKMVDKLPFYSTTAKSNINFTAEVAAIKPGHNRAINAQDGSTEGGVVSIDDFEGAVSGYPLSSQPNRWVLASVDPRGTEMEGALSGSLVSGANRARLSWYIIDRFVNNDNNARDANPYTRRINQTELFNRQIPQAQLPDLLTFDMTYFPDERGPYNFDIPGGITEGGRKYTEGVRYNDELNDIELLAPETRWAGVMRYLNNNDFEAANYEFIEFWLLNPFMEKPDGSDHLVDEEGYLTFHLGNVSEDILKDNLQFFENSVSRDPDRPEASEESVWGEVPLRTPINNAFPGQDFTAQDVGLDGLSNAQEQAKFNDWANTLRNNLGTLPAEVQEDLAGDDFVFFNDETRFPTGTDVLERYKYSNNPQGNSPNISNSTTFRRGNPEPDKEDMNGNRSLESAESFYEYKLKLVNDNGTINREAAKYVRDVRTVPTPGTGEDELWYRMRIPLNDGEAVGGIQGFRSIQFIRILVNQFATQKTFRMAEFELIRNQWRRQQPFCGVGDNRGPSDVNFNIDVVGIEENQAKQPFGYVEPPGIQREQIVTSFAPILQDENSLAMKFDSLGSTCEASITKLTELDLRVFEKLQMFVHAEDDFEKPTDIDDGDLSIFLRVGKDFERHYYEYEIPLTISRGDQTRTSVWLDENKFDFLLDLFIQAKKIRNVLNMPLNEEFTLDFQNGDLMAAVEGFESIFIDEEMRDSIIIPRGHKITVIGNPNLGLVKGINIGIRNKSDVAHSGEVWINELRLAGLQERGGVAGLARLDMQLADLGAFTSSASYSSIGFGQIDQRVGERALEETIEYDFATNLQLGNFFPRHWGVQIPFYGQYANSIVNPEYDAYDLDITVEDEKDLFKNRTAEEQADLLARNQQVSTIKTLNLTNVKKNKTTAKPNQRSSDKRGAASSSTKTDPVPSTKVKKPRKPMPWDISNFSASYSYTEKEYRDPIIEEDKSKEQTFGLDYNYSRRGGYIQPFKKVKNKNLRFIKEINFNPFPNSISINSTINRFESQRTFRIPDTPIFRFDDKRFTWDRRYDMNWNLTKLLKVNFTAFNQAYIDEARPSGIAATPDDREWSAFYRSTDGTYFKDDVTEDIANDPEFARKYWKNNLRAGGRNTNYDHSLNINYTLPTKYIPYMDWIDITAKYNAGYDWSAGALINDSDGFAMPGVIQNDQTRQVNFNLKFDKLYNKFKYVKNLDKYGKSRTKSRVDETKGEKVTVSKDGKGRTTRKKATRQPGAFEKIVLRPLFMLRSIKFNYKEDFSTIIPGYTGTPEYLGLDDSFSNPGTGFILGLQPDIVTDTNNPGAFLDKATANGWITESSALNQEVVQTANQSFDAKFKIEPWKSFKIDVDFEKNFKNTKTLLYKNFTKDLNEPTDFLVSNTRDVGSFDMTYFNMQTLFGRSIDELFATFEDNRIVISDRLPNNTSETDSLGYAIGYGRQSSSVLVPAFLAAYTNRDVSTITEEELEMDLGQVVSKRNYIPKPNWNLRYDGLTKLPWFKDRFSSFTLEHGYSSRLRVTNFSSDLEYGGIGSYDFKENGNYYTRIDIPAIQVTENFNPIIGVNMKTKNDFVLEFEYVKSRDLNLRINTSAQLEEDKKTSFVFGLGYTIKDSNFLKKKKRTRRSRREKDEDLLDKQEEEGNKLLRTNTVQSSRGSDMVFMLNVAFSDNQFFVHELDLEERDENGQIFEDILEDDQQRGQKSFQINPTVDYQLNETLNVRAFFDYNSTLPYGSSSFPRTSIAAGLALTMTLK